MDPTQLIPIPDILPAPWGLFNILLIVTFTIHLLLANILLGGTFLALRQSLTKPDAITAERCPLEDSKKLPFVMALTINMGVAPLLFLQVIYGQFFYVSSVLMAVYWLSIFLLIIFAYYGIYLFVYKYNALARARVWIMGTTLIFLIIVGFFFSNSLVLMIDPASWTDYFTRPDGKIIHLFGSTLIPRYLHFILASLATAGLLIGLKGWWMERKGYPVVETIYGNGLVFYGIITGFQFFIGAWYLGTIPPEVLSAVVFESHLAFPVFLVSIVTGLGSILFSLSKMPLHTAITFLLTIFFMILFRYSIREAHLTQYFNQNRPEVVTQLGPAIIFFIIFAIGILLIAFLIRLAMHAGQEASV
ncbi:MAG: hypothetical protein JW882_19480 [Deltaproteobacteria bacterium]|nr:hypothetical protein [Deltaproteobacteria bacterium]